MAAASDKAVIHVKRIKKVEGGHHGGAWKIAYADFVTAMMAFFLLMWLLGSTAKGDLSGISEYFKTPLKVALAGGSGSGDSSSIIKGGGQDLTRSAGQVKEGEREGKKSVVDIKAAEAERARRERAYLKGLQEKIQNLIAQNPKLAPYSKQLLIDITSEGLRIQIVDEQNRPMFATGSAALKPYTAQILHELAPVLNDVDSRIGLAGHTDGAAYAFGDKGYSNWELSADRANASRRELIAGGLDEGKIIRVVGLGSAVMLNEKDPLDATNRRVSIIIMNKATQSRVQSDGVSQDATLEASLSEPLDAETVSAASGAPAVAGQAATAASR